MSGMRGGRLVSVCVLLLALTACRDKAAPAADAASAEAALTAPVPAPPALLETLTVTTEPADPVRLRYQPQAQARYAVTLDQESAQVRQGRRLELATQQTFVLERRLQGEPAADQWTFVTRFEDLSVVPAGDSKHKEIAAAAQAIAAALERLRFTVTVTPRGEVLAFAAGGGEAGKWRDVLEPLIKETVVPLPAEPVRPGDSWTDSRRTVLERRVTTNTIQHDVRATFLGWVPATDACARCVAVRVEGEFTIAGEVTAPNLDGTADGLGRTDAVAVLDVERGLLVRSETSTAVAQRFHLAGKSELAFVEEMSSRLTQELVPPPKEDEETDD